MRRQLSNPSFVNGFARSRGESLCPELWADLGAWVPALGMQGDILQDVTARRNCELINAPAWSNGGLTFTRTSQQRARVLTTLPVLGYGAYTAVFTIKYNYGTNGGYGAFGTYAPAFAVTSAGKPYLYSGGYRYIGSDGDIPDGQIVTVIFVRRASTGYTECWVEGRYLGYVDISYDIAVGRYVLGSDSNTLNTRGLEGVLYASYLYARELTTAQILALSADPLLPLRRKPFVPMYVPSGAGNAFTRTISETVGITDAAAKASAISRILSETVGATDAEAKAQGKVIADPLGLSETVSHVYGAIRIAADTLGISDDLARVWGKVATLSDTVGITDDLSRLAVLARVLSETVGLTDLASIFGANTITITDTMGITDDVARLIAYLRAPTDDIGMLDSMLRVTAALRTISDSAGLTDSVQSQLGDVVAAAFAFMILRQTR